MRLACIPTASRRLSLLFMATTDGSFRTTPSPRVDQSVGCSKVHGQLPSERAAKTLPRHKFGFQPGRSEATSAGGEPSKDRSFACPECNLTRYWTRTAMQLRFNGPPALTRVLVRLPPCPARWFTTSRRLGSWTTSVLQAAGDLVPSLDGRDEIDENSWSTADLMEKRSRIGRRHSTGTEASATTPLAWHYRLGTGVDADPDQRGRPPRSFPRLTTRAATRRRRGVAGQMARRGRRHLGGKAQRPCRSAARMSWGPGPAPVAKRKYSRAAPRRGLPANRSQRSAPHTGAGLTRELS